MKSVLIFGQGKYYKHIKNEIEKKYSIAGFIDNYLIGDNIYHPVKDAKQIEKHTIIIAIYNFFDALEQLLSAGINSENVILAANDFVFKEEDIFRNKMGKYIIRGNRLFFLSETIGNYVLDTKEKYDELNRSIRSMYEINDIPFDKQVFSQLPTRPYNRDFGAGRGETIARYYIRKFLEECETYVHGDVMEIGDNRYTLQFGNNISSSKVLSVVEGKNDCVKGDIQSGEGLQANTLDCFILTQVLDHVYDLDSSCKNIVNALKPGGIALITVSGIGQIARLDMEMYGEFWFFTDLSIKRLFEKYVDKNNIIVKTYGNLKSAIAKLMGVSAQEIGESDLDYNDQDYQVLIAAIIKKNER